MRDKQRDKQCEKLRELWRIVCECFESTISTNQIGIKIAFKACYTSTLLIQEKLNHYLIIFLLRSLEWVMGGEMGVKMGGGGGGRWEIVADNSVKFHIRFFCHQVKKELASAFVLESRERKGTVSEYLDRNPFLTTVNETDIMSRVRFLGSS